MVGKTEIIEKLKSHKAEIQRKYPVESLGLFGSYARGEETESSDVDILVEFNEPVGIEYIDLILELEKILSKPVDLIIKKNLYVEVKSFVERDIISI